MSVKEQMEVLQNQFRCTFIYQFDYQQQCWSLLKTPNVFNV